MIFSVLSGKFILMKCETIIYGLCAGVVFSVKMAGKDFSVISDEPVAAAREPERQNVA